MSGRDVTSVKCLSSVLQLSKSPVVLPDDVAFVRDTVLSDKSLSDTEGNCWKQSEGAEGGGVLRLRRDANFSFHASAIYRLRLIWFG